MKYEVKTYCKKDYKKSLAFLFNFPFYDSFCNLIYFHNSFLYRKNKQDVSHLFSTPCILSRKATSFTESSECFCNANHSIWSLSLLFCFDFNRESLWNDQLQRLTDLLLFRTRFHVLPIPGLLHQKRFYFSTLFSLLPYLDGIKSSVTSLMVAGTAGMLIILAQDRDGIFVLFSSNFSKIFSCSNCDALSSTL